MAMVPQKHSSVPLPIRTKPLNHPPFTSLNTAANEIRLLDLHPAVEDGDPLVCSLRVVSLDTSNNVFEAVSYVSGDESNTYPADVDGVSDCPITANLNDALRMFRRDDGTMRTLWVDALCID